MNRRKFLFFLPIVVLAPKIIVDTFISVPFQGIEIVSSLTEAEIVANELALVYSKLPTLFDRDNVFYAKIKACQDQFLITSDTRVPLQLGDFDEEKNP